MQYRYPELRDIITGGCDRPQVAVPVDLWPERRARAGYWISPIGVPNTRFGVVGIGNNKENFMRALAVAVAVAAELMNPADKERPPLSIALARLLEGHVRTARSCLEQGPLPLQDVKWGDPLPVCGEMNGEPSAQDSAATAALLEPGSASGRHREQSRVPTQVGPGDVSNSGRPSEAEASGRSGELAGPEPTRARGHLPEYEWLREAREWECSKDIEDNSLQWIPAICLRWTHKGISRRFKDNRKLTHTVEDLFYGGRRWWETMDIPPLVVVLEGGRLWSLSNRRLAAFRMLQGVTNETVWVKCRVHKTYHRRFSEVRALSTENEGRGVRPNSEEEVGWSRDKEWVLGAERIASAPKNGW